MRLGILADVHANADALQAVLDNGNGYVDRWWFIGDVVGYGPAPVETLELLRSRVNTRHWIVGNHDAWLVDLPWIAAFFNGDAVKTLQDHRGQLKKHAKLWRWCRRTWTDARAAPRLIREGHVDFWLAHARVDHYPDCILPYVFPAGFTGYDGRSEAFRLLREKHQDHRPVALIHGHTHVPYILVWPWGLERWVPLPIRYGEPQRLDQYDAVLLNPGSVGQPRNPDRMVHAAYGILDTDASTFEFRRVPYESGPTCLVLARKDYPIWLIWSLQGIGGERSVEGDDASDGEWARWDKNPVREGWRKIYRERPWGWEPVASPLWD